MPDVQGSLTILANAVGTAAAPLAEGAANPSVTTSGALLHQFNGTTWDRARGNWNTLTGDTGAKVATGNGALQTNYSNRGAVVVFNVGAVTGTTPTVLFTVQGSADGGTTFYNLPNATTASITATGVYTLTIHPDILEVATSVIKQPVPRNWRVVWTIGGTTPSFTITNVQVAYLV